MSGLAEAEDGVDQAGAKPAVQRGTGEQRAVADRPEQELVDEADLGAGEESVTELEQALVPSARSGPRAEPIADFP